MVPLLLLRADASESIGTGHVMRSLALAQAWTDLGGRALLAAAALPEPLAARFAAEGVGVRRLEAAPGSEADAAATVAVAAEAGAACAVLDGYAFGPGFQAALHRATTLMVVDDHGHHPSHCAAVVLDQNVGASPGHYPRAGEARLLLGPRFALLRREFSRAAAEARPVADRVGRVVVTLGGAGRPGLAELLADALEPAAADGVVVELVLGPAHAGAEATGRHARSRGLGVRVAVADMAAVLAGADLVVSAAGSTVYEIAALGIPALVTSIADDHPPFVAALAGQGAAVDLGPWRSLDAGMVREAVARLAGDVERRRALAAAGRRLVDGRGASRVAKHLLAEAATLRPAVREDVGRLFDWANEPGARAGSFSSRAIEWDEHVAWFESRLKDPRSHTLIIELGGVPAGYLRFDLEGDDAVVSITIAREARGLGLAGRVTVRAAELLWAQGVPMARLHAYTRPENTSSAATLANGGFRALGETTVKGNPALHFVLPREER